MRSSDLPFVRSVRLFETMDLSVFERLMHAAYLQTFPAQLTLIVEGDPADFLFVVIEGRVELFATSHRRETSMIVVEPFGTFILAAVLKDATYLMSARTLERSQLLLIPAESVREAIEEDPAFAHTIIVELADRCRTVVKEHKNLKLRTAVERLANRLLRYNLEQGGTGRLELPYEKKVLASLLGMTPENLSRAFSTLKPYGVEVQGTNVCLTDMKSLEVLAKPDPLIDDPMQ